MNKAEEHVEVQKGFLRIGSFLSSFMGVQQVQDLRESFVHLPCDLQIIHAGPEQLYSIESLSVNQNLYSLPFPFVISVFWAVYC